MSISKQLAAVIDPDWDLNQKLKKIAQWLDATHNIELYFCQILGKRWSFIAGRSDLYAPQRKVCLTDQYGMVLEDKQLSEKQLEQLTKAVRRIIINHA